MCLDTKISSSNDLMSLICEDIRTESFSPFLKFKFAYCMLVSIDNLFFKLSRN